MNKQVAFDYDKQVWIEGAQAVQVRADQIKESLEILRGPRAQDYLAFVGIKDTPAQAIAKLEGELAKLFTPAPAQAVKVKWAHTMLEAMRAGYQYAGHTDDRSMLAEIDRDYRSAGFEVLFIDQLSRIEYWMRKRTAQALEPFTL